MTLSDNKKFSPLNVGVNIIKKSELYQMYQIWVRTLFLSDMSPNFVFVRYESELFKVSRYESQLFFSHIKVWTFQSVQIWVWTFFFPQKSPAADVDNADSPRGQPAKSGTTWQPRCSILVSSHGREREDKERTPPPYFGQAGERGEENSSPRAKSQRGRKFIPPALRLTRGGREEKERTPPPLISVKRGREERKIPPPRAKSQRGRKFIPPALRLTRGGREEKERTPPPSYFSQAGERGEENSSPPR